MLTPRKIKPPPVRDLQERLDAVPASLEPYNDSGRGPMRSRVNYEPSTRPHNDTPNVPAFLPWIPGHTPKNNPWLPATSSHMKWGTAHRSQSFIEGKTTSRNDKSGKNPLWQKPTVAKTHCGKNPHWVFATVVFPSMNDRLL